MVKVGKKNCWMCTTQRQQKMATESKALVKNTGHILTPPFVVTLKIQKHLITEVIKYIEICHDKKKKYSCVNYYMIYAQKMFGKK